jgi:cell division transport system ATP-binding protein
MIHFEHVFKRYPNGREALQDVSFRIGAGEFVFLTGRSGAGKSSVLKLVALLERPTRGSVLVNGQDTGSLPARAVPAYRRRLGVVFQDHQLLMDRPVYDNVALPLMVSDTRYRDIDKRGIARAVVARPTILIADEPTGNLDHNLARDVMQLFTRFQEVGVTVVIATHDMALVREFGHRELHIDEGRLLGGTTAT